MWQEIKRFFKTLFVLAIIIAVGFLVYKTVYQEQGFSFSKEQISKKIDELSQKASSTIAKLKEGGKDYLAKESTKVAVSGLETLKEKIGEKIKALQQEYNLATTTTNSTSSLQTTAGLNSASSNIQIINRINDSITFVLSATKGAGYEINWDKNEVEKGILESETKLISHIYKESGEYLITIKLIDSGKTYSQLFPIKIFK